MKVNIDPRYTAVLAKVETYCLDNENPLLVSKYARYFREGYDAFGLDDEQIRALVKSILAEYPYEVEEVAELGWHLFQPGKYEFGTVAILLLKHYRGQFNRTVFDWVHHWFDRGVENWAHSDVLCSLITPVFLEQDIVSLDDFAAWRDSESRWTRRSVPVTMLTLRKTTDPQVLLDFIDPMMMDDARVVHQGLGWFLRELWKLHHEEVETFLAKHKETCARLIIQYATEKMKPETKELFRREKTRKPDPAWSVAKTTKKKPLPPKDKKHKVQP